MATETITLPTGETFTAYCAVPESGRGPGVILFQEIFGVNANMRSLADQFAAEGFVAVVPDMFWRIEPGFERPGEESLEEAFGMMQRFDRDAATGDMTAVHAHLLGMEACTGTVGVTGFCLGGALAFVAAATSRVDGRGPDAAVCYYGSAINDLLGLVDRIECPIAFHYGEQDPYIPPENIDAVEAAVAGLPNVEFWRYPDAGHGFSNGDSPSMYEPEAAALAWERTVGFFRRHLGQAGSAP